MSARTRWYALSIAILFVGAPASRAVAGPWTLAPGEFYSEIRGSWQSSDTYHDSEGGRPPLFGGGLWEERGLASHSEFGFRAPKWMGWLGVFSAIGGMKDAPMNFLVEIPVQSVTRRLGDAAGSRDLGTATGLGDALIGLRLPVTNGKVGAAIEIVWKAPLGYDRSQYLTRADSIAAGDNNGDGDSLDANAARQLGSPVLGDGQQDISFQLHLGMPAPRGFLQVSGGYKLRFETPQDQIVLGADLGMWMTRSLMLAGRYQGQMASDGDRPTDEADFHRAGPSLVYRVDDHMDLFVGSMHTVTAKNALHTDQAYVGFAFRQTRLNRIQGFLGGTAAP